MAPMSGPDTRRSPERLGKVVEYLLRYRLYSSPEDFAQRHPNLVGLQATNIRSIIKGKDGAWLSPLKLTMLAGALEVPPSVLVLVLEGDAAGIDRLAWPERDVSLRQWLADQMALWSKGTERHAGTA